MPSSSAVTRGEMLGEHGDVLGTLAQRRDLDRHHAQPVEQVLAEAAVAHVLVEVAVRRRDDAHVDLLGALAADRRDLVALQHAQQLGLQVERHVADLVEEERAARRLAEASRARIDGAGEGALLVAEEFALEQLARDRRRVHRDEGARRARRRLVDRARHQFLAGAALAGDQHRDVARGHASDRLEDLEDRAAAADQAIARAARAAAHFAAQRAHLALERARAQRLLDQRQHRGHLERLHQIVERAALHRLDGVLERVLRGDHHHRGFGSHAAQAVEQLEAGGLGHADVEEGDVEAAARQQRPRRLARIDVDDLVTGLFERLAQHEADRRLVVGDQHARLRFVHAALLSGSSTRTRVP